MRGKVIALTCGIVFVAAGPLFAPQPGKPQSQEPFARPKPVCTIKGSDVKATLKALVPVLTRQGFTPTQAFSDDGEVHLVKASGDSEDRIILWLAWELNHPKERFNVFLVCGHFEKFFGTAELKRVTVNASEDQERFGPVRSAVIAEALQRE